MLDNLRRREQIIDLLCDQGSVRVEPLSVLWCVIGHDPQRLTLSGAERMRHAAPTAGQVLNQHFALDRPLRIRTG